MSTTYNIYNYPYAYFKFSHKERSGVGAARAAAAGELATSLSLYCTVRTDCPTECPTDRTPAAAALTLADTHHNLAKH